MARHWDGKRNWAMSTGAIVALTVFIIAIVAAIWGWVRPIGQAGALAQGNCEELKVAVQPESLIKDLNELPSDHCRTFIPTTKEYADMVVSAAPAMEGLDSQVILTAPVGVVGPRSVDPFTLAPEQVSFPPESIASPIAAQALDIPAEPRDGAEFSVNSRPEATEGVFSPIEGAQVDYTGSALTDKAKNFVDQFASEPVPEEQTSANQETPVAPAAPQPPASQAPVADMPQVLFVLDTSHNMEDKFADVSAQINDIARQLTESQHSVALWNYSSPLSDDAEHGWRENVDFTSDPALISEALESFGTGGDPQSRSALIAALDKAQARAQESGQPVHVVFITTATFGDIDNDTFLNRAHEIPRDNVALTVVHLGDEQSRDDTLASVANAAVPSVAEAFQR